MSEVTVTVVATASGTEVGVALVVPMVGAANRGRAARQIRPSPATETRRAKSTLPPSVGQDRQVLRRRRNATAATPARVKAVVPGSGISGIGSGVGNVRSSSTNEPQSERPVLVTDARPR